MSNKIRIGTILAGLWLGLATSYLFARSGAPWWIIALYFLNLLILAFVVTHFWYRKNS